MSADQPWLKFFPTDWRADQSLRVVSLAARGLWIECMCIMHEADPYGHLVVNGRPVTDTQLASLTGATPDHLAELLAELEAAGVFSRNGKGVIYSRRMTRDHKKAQTARKTGKSGGNPTLCKTKGNPPSDKGAVKGRVKGGDNTQRPEARIQNTPLTPQGGTGEILDFGIKDRALLEAYERRLRGFATNRFWIAGGTWGPPPTDPDCEIPRAMIRHYLPDTAHAAD